MMRLRYSLASLMGLVLFCAVAMAALRQADQVWASLLFSGAIVVLGTAVLAAVFARGARRGFWVGFCAFGWAYLALAFAPGFESDIRPRLMTAYLLDQLYGRLHTQEPTALSVTLTRTQSGNAVTSVAFSPDGRALAVKGRSGVRVWNATTGAPLQLVLNTPAPPTPHAFKDGGHALASLLAAMMGGLIGGRLAARRLRLASAGAELHQSDPNEKGRDDAVLP